MNNEKNELLILGNGFDLAHGVNTSYSLFYEFVDMSRKLWILIKDKTKKECHKDARKIIDESEFVKKCDIAGINKKSLCKRLDDELLYKGQSKNAYNYKVWTFLKCVYDDSVNDYRYFYKTLNKEKGIEESILENVNDNKYENISKDQLIRENIMLNWLFSEYIKDIVVNILYKLVYVEKIYGLVRIPYRVSDLLESEQNIKNVLCMNYTRMLFWYSSELNNFVHQNNGKIEYCTAILGINENEINEDLREKYNVLDKNYIKKKMIETYIKMHKGEANIERKQNIEKRIIDLLQHFSLETGKYDSSFLLEDINSILIIGHSIGTADWDLLRPLFMEKHVEKITILVYVEEIKKKSQMEIDKAVEESKEKKQTIRMLCGNKKKGELTTNEKAILDKVEFKPLKMQEVEFEKPLNIDVEYNKNELIYQQYNSQYKTVFEQIEEQMKD